jgi:peptidoglycan hydrolase-like amidase
MRTVLQIALILTVSLAPAQQVRIGVLGLFHPKELIVASPAGSAAVLHIEENRIILEKSSGSGSANFHIAGNQIIVNAGGRTFHTSSVVVTGREGGAVNFILTVPGKITRHYKGTLEMKAYSGTLIAVVSMDLETAVASVAGAESTPDAPIEAFKAQAVAARSYLTAGKGRHHGFDFCDTTHCQLLREPPVPAGRVATAVSETRGLVLTFKSQSFAAMYTRSCSGQTKTPVDIGMPGDTYPYYSVECKYCREHPFRLATSHSRNRRRQTAQFERSFKVESCAPPGLEHRSWR